MALSIMSSNFTDNYGNIIWCITAGNKTSIMLDNSNFINSKLAVDTNDVVDMII